MIQPQNLQAKAKTKVNTEVKYTQGSVESLSKAIKTNLEVTEIFQGLSLLNQNENSNNSLLLETCDIKTNQQANNQAGSNAKSILMLQAALRIECHGQKVELKALTPNGNNALIHIAETLKLSSHILVSVYSTAQLSSLKVVYQKNEQTIDEDSKLKQDTSIDLLREIKNSFKVNDNNEFSIFLCGLFSFDLIASTESLPAVKTGKNTCPDYVFYLAESLMVFDKQRQSIRYICNHFKTSAVNNQELEKSYYELSRGFEKLEQQLNQINPLILNNSIIKPTVLTSINNVEVDVSQQQFEQQVIQLKQQIVQGNIFQVVPSRTFSLKCVSPLASYKALRKTNPSPYLFYMQDEAFTLFGASPESALKYTQDNNQVELYPIAGTRQRGKKRCGEIDLDLDIRIEVELKMDHKEIAEHMMLVDLARNDIARISQPGSVHVPKLLEVDRYSQVMHLVSRVQGQLKPELDALHAYKACMNMGTLTGAPKIKASHLIREVEQQRRGSYGGAIGYLNAQGDMDTCIVIRSAFCQHGMAHIQAGAGVVFDSVPELEAKETENKALAVIKAIQSANLSQLQDNKALQESTSC